ncbi:MAG: hypothetical protein O2954_19235 [bacterium]|nr:hypothetical protein [bacterium]
MVSQEKPRDAVTMLVVDYGTGAARLLGCAFQRPGVNLRRTTGNVEALRIAKEDPPDLVLIDLTSGSNSGYLLAALLKNQKHFNSPRVAGISTLGGRSLEQMAPGLQPLGFDRCVSLTWPIQRRVEVVDEMLDEVCC